MAEQAVTHTIQGNHRLSVQSLLQQGERTLNAKLLDMARMTLQRHQAKISDADDLSAMVEDLRKRFCIGSGMPSLGQGSRQAGGLKLREGGAKAAAAEQAPAAIAATGILEPAKPDEEAPARAAAA